MTAEKKQLANYERRRTQIIGVATRLFARKGYTATSVNEICSATKMGRGVLYYYLPGGKQELLFQIHERFIQRLTDDFEAAVAPDRPADESLRELGCALMKIITEYKDEVTVFFHEWKSLVSNKKMWPEVRARRRYIEDIVRTEIERGQSEGVFQPVDAKLATLAFFGMHNWAYQWVDPRGRIDSATIASTFSLLFLDGLRKPATACPA
ncbi:hypothetical protein AYO38_01355 [bacterium SCGC AG-212-C10]|nr:hypothetical protein AYO38_01355 [bacterium SCGC AG-212-C10]